MFLLLRRSVSCTAPFVLGNSLAAVRCTLVFRMAKMSAGCEGKDKAFRVVLKVNLIEIEDNVSDEIEGYKIVLHRSSQQ